jgi:hypothetical protein
VVGRTGISAGVVSTEGLQGRGRVFERQETEVKKAVL